METLSPNDQAKQQHKGTKPENLGSSNKRQKYDKLALYRYLLPVPLANQAKNTIYPGESSVPAPSYPWLISLTLNNLLCPPPIPQLDATYDKTTKTTIISGDNYEELIFLWRRGFFGKGALSRSEPAWQKRKENIQKSQPVLTAAEDKPKSKKPATAEELTAIRREQRKVNKLAKKAERDAERLAAANKWNQDSQSASPLAELDGTEGIEKMEVEEVEDAGEEKYLELKADQPILDVNIIEETTDTRQELPKPTFIEPLHLQPEEVFFLIFSVGALNLYTRANPFTSRSSSKLSILDTWSLFLHSRSPEIRLDNPFLLSYVVYHHFRSMGWVVRSGVKFCVDWMVYGIGGPVGGHAEFAVLVIPEYTDPEYQVVKDERAEGEAKNSWKWFNTVNRICSGVKKTLVLVYVTIPKTIDLPLGSRSESEWILHDPALVLSKYTVREVVIRRWVGGKMRD